MAAMRVSMKAAMRVTVAVTRIPVAAMPASRWL